MIDVIPLKDEAFGAVVTGIITDRPLMPDDIEQIKDALATIRRLSLMIWMGILNGY